MKFEIRRTYLYEVRLLIMIGLPLLLGGLIFHQWGLVLASGIMLIEAGVLAQTNDIVQSTKVKYYYTRKWIILTIQKIRFRVFGTPTLMERLKTEMWNAGYTHFRIKAAAFGRFHMYVWEDIQMINKIGRWYEDSPKNAFWVILEQFDIGGCGSTTKGCGGYMEIRGVPEDEIETGDFFNPKNKRQVANGGDNKLENSPQNC